MATKIILLAQDIKVGTEIVQFALASGAAIMEYGEVDSPLAKPKKKKAAKAARYGGKYRLTGGNDAKEGSLRYNGFVALTSVGGEMSRIHFTKELMEHDFSETQAKSIVSGLIKTGTLARAA